MSIVPEEPLEFISLVDKSSKKVIPQTAMEASIAETVVGLWISSNGKLPSFTELQRYFPAEWSTEAVIDTLSSKNFYTRMVSRGVAWPENWTPYIHDTESMRARLTPQQIVAIQMVCDPTDRRALGMKLKRAGVTHGVWTAWMRDPVFAQVVNRTSENILQDTVAIAHTRLAEKVDKGDIAAIKTLYEVSGRHDPNKQQMLDFTKVLSLVLEVMQRHITDPAVLRRIGEDLDDVIAGEVIQPVEQMPANTGNAELPPSTPNFLEL